MSRESKQEEIDEAPEEEVVWEEIVEAPYKSTENRLVVCMDTLR